MPKFFKIFYIFLASIILAAGAALISVSFAKDVFASEIKTNEYVIDESFDEIKINFRTADINIESTTELKTKIVCKDKEKDYHEVKIEDNKLIVKNEDKLEWYEKFFDFPFNRLSVTIYLPIKIYSNFEIKGTTGDINISNININKIDASTTTGDVILKKVESDTLILSSTTGDIVLEDTIATTKINIAATTGDVVFKDADSLNITVTVTTGDIEGTLLTGKVFHASTTTGDKSVPSDDPLGGVCNLTTTTGDIDISIKN